MPLLKWEPHLAPTCAGRIYPKCNASAYRSMNSVNLVDVKAKVHRSIGSVDKLRLLKKYGIIIWPLLKCCSEGWEGVIVVVMLL